MTDAELVNDFRAGDETAFEELLRRHRGMTRKIPGRYFIVGWTYDDLVLEAEVGLWEAACTWNGEGIFGSWAAFVAQRKIITLIKTSTRQKALPLRAHTDLTSSNLHSMIESGAIGGLMEDPLDLYIDEEEQRENQAIVAEMLEVLTDCEARVFLGWLAGQPYKLIAIEIGISRKSVDNALQRAKGKLVNADY